MLVNGKHYRSLWPAANGRDVECIDQTRLPHEFIVATISDLAGAMTAISDMWVRGAPLIGAMAAYGMCLGLQESCSVAHLEDVGQKLISCRPTAVNLQWAVRRMQEKLRPLAPEVWLENAYREAAAICDEDAAANEALGSHGCTILEQIWEKKGRTGVVNVLTHCNAGWLATVDWGTALAPVFKAKEAGIPIHVWVDETRPRNQGAHLTAWELAMEDIDHHLIVDNVGGHLMQHGMVDVCIVGTDRTAANGDVCNKIGTYLKALAAADNNVPFYVSLPGSTIDWQMTGGMDIPIEQREQEEVLYVQGKLSSGQVGKVMIAPETTPAANYAFDVTPARLVTGLITERGVCPASTDGLLGLYPERKA